jgi:hypothetical protein
VSHHAVARGDGRALINTIASGRVALLGIDRSRAAIQGLQEEEDDARLAAMSGHLRRLAREVEGRFPEARRFVRPGLDAPT